MITVCVPHMHHFKHSLVLSIDSLLTTSQIYIYILSSRIASNIPKAEYGFALCLVQSIQPQPAACHTILESRIGGEIQFSLDYTIFQWLPNKFGLIENEFTSFIFSYQLAVIRINMGLYWWQSGQFASCRYVFHAHKHRLPVSRK